MIKFFRHFRYDLMNQNKTSKYFKYAIGEIILVVIGILIALQINNWNQYRLQHIEEDNILISIKEDFENAIVEFKDLNTDRERLVKTSLKLYSLIQNKKTHYNKAQIDSLLANLIVNPTYNSQTKTIEVLFSSGKISLISKGSIKSRLLSWPQKIEDMIEGEILGSDALLHKVYPLLSKYVSIFDINRKLSFKNYQIFDTTLKSAYPSNYEDLFKDRDFENVLSERELFLQVAMIETSELINEAESIIKLINTHLESK